MRARFDVPCGASVLPPHASRFSPQPDMSVIRTPEQELARFRGRLAVAGAVALVCFGLLAARFGLEAVFPTIAGFIVLLLVLSVRLDQVTSA